MTRSSTDYSELGDKLRELIGSEHVRAATRDDSVGGVQPAWLAEPASSVDIARVLAMADARKLKVLARGAGSKLAWGNPPANLDVILSARRLDRVVEHAAGDMTATVQAGCTIADVQSRLAQGGQRLALDPLWPERATIGGVLATNDSGALRAAFGPARDLLIGITVVLPDGTIARSGGKVVKNVAGYDLPKLFIGSYGTLGIITEATFRLHPLPIASQTLAFEVPSSKALAPMWTAISECALLITAAQIEVSSSAPRPRLTLRVEAAARDALADKVARIVAAIEAAGARAEEDTRPDPFDARQRLYDAQQAAVCKFSCLPTQWGDVIEVSRKIADRLGVSFQMVGQIIGVGTIGIESTQIESLAEAVREMRTQIESRGGSLVVHHVSDALSPSVDAWGHCGDALPLMRRIKQQFDPNGILSPGRFVGGI